MYRATSPQLSLLEPHYLIPGILPEDDWSYIYKDSIWPLIDENKFKHLYKEEGGAPNKSIRLKVSILIFMSLEQVNWRQAEFLFMRRLDWMNATYTELGKAFIDHTTLFKFYQALEKDTCAYQLFVDLAKSFIEKCNVSTKKQRVDSFFMTGWLAILSRYGLFKETIRVFLQALRKHKPGLYGDIKKELSIDYLQDNFDLTEKDKEKTRGRIKEMALDLYQIKSAFERHSQVKHYETFKILVQIFDQQCEIKSKKSNESEPLPSTKETVEIIAENQVELEKNDDTAPSSSMETIESSLDAQPESCEEEQEYQPEIELRKKPKGDRIISSPHNTEAQYTRKRKQTVVGHKGFATETCDPDNDVQFITDVNLETATHADAKEISEIEQRLEDNDIKPDVLFGDAGFVNGESIIESEQKEIDLAGPSAGRSQSFEAFHSKERPYDIKDFKVEIREDNKEMNVISCPKKQEALAQNRSEKTGKWLVHFSSEICRDCDSQQICPVKIGVHKATLFVNEEQYAGAARHHKYMSDVDYRKECGVRAGAESLVNEVANAHGARTSKHTTESGSRLQLIFASIACNTKRFIQTMQNCVKDQSELAKMG